MLDARNRYPLKIRAWCAMSAVYSWVGDDLTAGAAMTITTAGSGTFTADASPKTPDTLPSILGWIGSYATASASSGETFTFTLSGERAVLSCTDVFSVSMSPSMAEALGFSSTSLSGAERYYSDATPAGFIGDVPVGFLGPTPRETVSVTEARHGRHWATAWSWGRRERVQIVMSSAQLAATKRGPIFGGKITVGDASIGYVTGHVASVVSVVPAWQDESRYIVTLDLGLEDG